MTTSPARRDQPPEWADANCHDVLEAAPDAMMVVNRAGEVVAANLQAQKLYGYSREHLVGSVVESLIPARLRDRHRQHRENFFANPETQAMQVLEIFAERSDASEFPVDVSLSRLTIGTVTFAISAIRDATDRRRIDELKRAEAVLRETRESENRYRRIVETTNEGVWLLDSTLHTSYVNRQMEEMLGYEPGEIVGHSVFDFYFPENVEHKQQLLKRRQQGVREQIEERLRRRDGSELWVRMAVSPMFKDSGEFDGALAMVSDITQRKRAEEALRESEARFRLAAQAGKMYAYEWDVATDVAVRSEEYANILGLTGVPRCHTRQQFLSRVHPDDRDRFIAAVADLTPENPTTQISYRVLRPDGAVIWLEKSGRAFFDAQGKMLRMIGIVADITERKLGEGALSGVSRKLIEAQEQERIRIARDLHDDFGQRLALLTIKLEQLQQNSPDLPAEVRSCIGELWKQTSEIAADIQSLSHELHSSRLEYLGIAAAMRAFCQEFGEQQKVEIGFKTRGLPTPVPPNVSLCLFRVLQEALHNSAKHSGVRRFEVQLRGTSDGIHLTVRDSGSGFDRKAAKESRGLGLISMEERLKLLKGTLSIESQPQRGTTIHARVPLSSGSDSMRAAG